MAALLLQAVTYGDTPQAIISGELVREGDVVNGFLVLVIEPRAVQLERDGVRLKLNL